MAPQKDGSVDLDQLWVEGDMSQGKAKRLLEVFLGCVEKAPDTAEQRLVAMGLTVRASNGKLQFKQGKVL